jgi:hypothetical protein
MKLIEYRTQQHEDGLPDEQVNMDWNGARIHATAKAKGCVLVWTFMITDLDSDGPVIRWYNWNGIIYKSSAKKAKKVARRIA